VVGNVKRLRARLSRTTARRHPRSCSGRLPATGEPSVPTWTQRTPARRWRPTCTSLRTHSLARSQSSSRISSA